MSRLSSGDLSRVRDKFADLPQDALPLEVDPTSGGGEETVKNRNQESIDWAFCPRHRHDGLGAKGGMTGLVAIDNKTVAFRAHTKKVGKVTVPCPGSGQIHIREGLQG